MDLFGLVIHRDTFKCVIGALLDSWRKVGVVLGDKVVTKSRAQINTLAEQLDMSVAMRKLVIVK